MKKGMFTVFIGISVLIFVILVNFLFNKPPTTLNEEYINSWILTGDESVDKILFTNNGQDYIACICSASEEEIMFLVLENNTTFDMHFRHSLTLNTLTENSTQTMTDKMFADENIIYNVFLNPDVNTVTINNVALTVHTFQYNGYTIGFWWSEM